MNFIIINNIFTVNDKIFHLILLILGLIFIFNCINIRKI